MAKDVLNNLCYFKYKIGDAENMEPYSFGGWWGCQYPNTFKYRVNGGAWITDTTTGFINITQFGINGGGVVSINLRDTTQITFNSTDVLEILCIVTSTNTLTNNKQYEFMMNHVIVNPIEIDIYSMECEKHLVNKSSELSLITDVYGQFTEEVDILNPSILFQYSGLFTGNYCYIRSFNRYYFINKITCVRNDLWRVDLHVDVLYSYNTDIRKETKEIHLELKLRMIDTHLIHYHVLNLLMLPVEH